MWLPPAQQAKLLEIEQKNRLARALVKGVQVPQGQMVGGRYVSPGIGGALVPLIQAIAGDRQETAATEAKSKFLSDLGNIGSLGDPKDLAKTGKWDLGNYPQTGKPEDATLRPQFDPRGGVAWSEDMIQGPEGVVLQRGTLRDGTTTYRPANNRGTTINMGGEKAFDTAMAGQVAKGLEEGADTARKSQKAFTTINNARDVLNRTEGVVTGPLADQIMWAKGLLGTMFGMDTTDVANSQELFSTLVRNLDGLAKEIGGAQISDQDRKTAMAAGGADLGLQVQAIQRILNKLEADSANNIRNYQARQEQARKAPMSQNGPQWIDAFSVPGLQIPEGLPQDAGGTYLPRPGVTPDKLKIPAPPIGGAGPVDLNSRFDALYKKKGQ